MVAACAANCYILELLREKERVTNEIEEFYRADMRQNPDSLCYSSVKVFLQAMTDVEPEDELVYLQNNVAWVESAVENGKARVVEKLTVEHKKLAREVEGSRIKGFIQIVTAETSEWNCEL